MRIHITCRRVLCESVLIFVVSILTVGNFRLIWSKEHISLLDGVMVPFWIHRHNLAGQDISELTDGDCALVENVYDQI